MNHPELTLTDRRFGQTRRHDAWWLQPLAVFLGLSVFGLYSLWVVFQGDHYHHGPYLSPFYAPLLFDPAGHSSGHSWLAGRPDWLPLWVPPSLLILWAPLGFRFTCYYYRGAYYKAFWRTHLHVLSANRARDIGAKVHSHSLFRMCIDIFCTLHSFL